MPNWDGRLPVDREINTRAAARAAGKDSRAIQLRQKRGGFLGPMFK